MRIISKFKDYYDGLMDYSKDDYNNKVWVRHSEKVSVSREDFKALEKNMPVFFSYYRNHFFSFFYIILVGKVYPVIRCSNIYQEEDLFYYSYDKFIEDFPDFAKPSLKWESIKNLFNMNYPDFTSLHLKLNTPLIRYDPEYINCLNPYRENSRECTINPSLRDIGFSKVMDSYEVYQELDMFVSNILVSDSMPEYPRSDVDKLESYGFDKKVSFRKRKDDEV